MDGAGHVAESLDRRNGPVSLIDCEAGHLSILPDHDTKQVLPEELDHTCGEQVDRVCRQRVLPIQAVKNPCSFQGFGWLVLEAHQRAEEIQCSLRLGLVFRPQTVWNLG